MIDKSLLPTHWDEEFKDEFIRQLDILLKDRITTVYQQYLEANLFKVNLNTPSNDVLKYIQETLYLDRLINTSYHRPPFIKVYVLKHDGVGSLEVKPGMLIYENGRIFFYLDLDQPAFISTTEPNNPNIIGYLYYTNAPMGKINLPMSRVHNVLGNVGTLSTFFTFYAYEVIGTTLYERFIPHTKNIFDFYDTFERENAKDILVLKSYNNSVRIYFSKRLLNKRYDLITMSYMNAAEFNLPYKPDEDLLKEIREKGKYKIKFKYYELSMEKRANSLFAMQKNIKSVFAGLKLIPNYVRFNGTIRSVNDIGTFISSRYEFIMDYGVVKYILRLSDNNYKTLYFIPIILSNDYRLISPYLSFYWYNEIIQNIKSNWNTSLMPYNIAYLSPLDDNLTMLEYYVGNNKFRYRSFRDLFLMNDVFIVPLSPLKLYINYDVVGNDLNQTDKVLSKIFARYVNTVHEKINNRELISILSKDPNIQKLVRLTVHYSYRVRAVLSNTDSDVIYDLVFSHPRYTAEAKYSNDEYYLINIKRFVNSVINLELPRLAGVEEFDLMLDEDKQKYRRAVYYPFLGENFNYVEGFHFNHNVDTTCAVAQLP